MDLPAEEPIAVAPALLGFADLHDDFVARLPQAVSQCLEVGSHLGD